MVNCFGKYSLAIQALEMMRHFTKEHYLFAKGCTCTRHPLSVKVLFRNQIETITNPPPNTHTQTPSAA